MTKPQPTWEFSAFVDHAKAGLNGPAHSLLLNFDREFPGTTQRDLYELDLSASLWKVYNNSQNYNEGPSARSFFGFATLGTSLYVTSGMEMSGILPRILLWFGKTATYFQTRRSMSRESCFRYSIQSGFIPVWSCEKEMDGPHIKRRNVPLWTMWIWFGCIQRNAILLWWLGHSRFVSLILLYWTESHLVLNSNGHLFS